ncbi:dTDP-4-dehydrorhamnose 3,5-epimerase [Cupriavidus taiwanensis]|uniref:dTDP-4-dehydrorhamnose 3,5-epimerase n=1 Tax=Cupriavidus taiwanensis TaxID=164546 RepID=UPI0039C2B923
MNIEATPIEGVMVVTSQAFADHRGAFQRLYCDKELADVLGGRHIVQANHSRTAQVGAVRGMHYQLPPHAEMKLVRCLRGRVWDVAVDLRQGSPTFLRRHAVELSAENGRMFVIPEGCAHGFQVLEPESELLYLHTAHYAPQAEGGVRHDDPQLGIEWPLPVADLSQRDRSHPLLTSDYSGIKL